jgi:hypothetical protein
MTVVSRVSFTSDGSIKVEFPIDPTRQGYIVNWGVVSLRPEQAEEAADKWGWTNLANISRPDILAQGMVEVRRSMMVHAKFKAEAENVDLRDPTK